MNENLRPVNNLQPFLNYCYTVGMLPTSYKVSMTYEEQVLEAIRYIKEEIIPTVNINALATTELQQKFVELVNFVETYFDDLDVQEEVNTKLDEMAESGELAELVSQYLESQAIIGFQTSNNLKNATNLANNSIARTLGNITYNDGKGAFYKIRTRLNSDVPDNYNIIELVNTQNLVAEIIPDYFRNNLQEQINNILLEDSVFVGDSYAAGTTFEHGSVEYLTSWCEYLRQLMGLTSGHYYIFPQGNAGFAKIGNNSMNFQMTLANRINEISDKTKIKNVFVCAGYNDWDQEVSLINQRIGEFINYCKEQFPNATVYLGMIGGDARDTNAGAQVRERLITRVLHAYTRCSYFGGVYLSGVELFTHNFFQFNEQGNHPNETGYHKVATMIYNAWKQGKAELVEPLTILSLPCVYGNNKTVDFQSSMQNDTKLIYMNNLLLTDQTINTQGIDSIKIVNAQTDNKMFKSTIDRKSIQIPCDLYVLDTSNNNYYAHGKIQIANDGAVYVQSTLFAVTSPTIKNIAIWPLTLSTPLLYS